jgi:hypothetical protein
MVSAAIAYACGPRPQSGGAQARKQGAAATQTLTSALQVSVSDHVELAFRVTNAAARPIEVNFPSGHTHDFVVTDTMGRELWKWSTGRLFTQSMQNRVLEREETLSYRAAWDPGPRKGTFLAVVSLNSENHPLEQRVRFSVP